MKKYVLIITVSILCSITDSVLAQSRDSLSYAENEVRKNYGIYHLAKRFNDPSVARMALYQILVYSPDETKVLDSLALDYYGQNNYVSAALVAKENILINDRNETALEIAAASLANLGVKDQALDYYEKLSLINNSTEVFYQVAFLQFDLKRFSESTNTINLLLKRESINDVNLVFPKQDKTTQEISMKAALNNLQGLIAQEKGDNAKAKELFLEALKATPGFELAQSNLSKVGK